MDTTTLLHAIDLALDDKWDEAHRTVQEYDDVFAAWIHAVLHRIEGDTGNSRYWYRRAGKEYPANLPPEEELGQIKEQLKGPS